MELRQLRCLVAAADTLHFGRAAQKLDMLPASLGRHIRLLEEGLGQRLLIRTTRHVEMTEEGRAFAKAARDILARADALERSFRDRKVDAAQTLRIGAIDSAAVGLIPLLLPHLRDAYPEIEVELMEQKTIRLLPRLLSGRLDLAIVRPPETWDNALELKPLLVETPVVALPSDHPLANHPSLRIEDIAEEPLIIPERRSRPHSHDLTIKLFLEAGFTARVTQVAEEKQTIVSLVSSGVGLAIVPKWASRLAVGGVSFVPLVSPLGPLKDKLSLSAVWARDTRHPAREAFLEVLDAHLAALANTA